MGQTHGQLQPISLPRLDGCVQAVHVFECLFTSSPQQFSPEPYHRLQQEQLTKIELHWPAQLDTSLEGTLEGEQGGKGGASGWKGGIFCLWKRAMEQVYQGSLNLRQKAGRWSEAVSSGTGLIFSKTTFHGLYFVASHEPRRSISRSEARRTLCYTDGHYMDS